MDVSPLKEADTALPRYLEGRYRTAAAFDYTQVRKRAASEAAAFIDREVHAATSG